MCNNSVYKTFDKFYLRTVRTIFDKFVLTCLQVMGTPIETLNKMGLIQFSGKGPWAEYEQRMFVYLRSQGLLQGLTKANVVDEHGHEIITTLALGANNAAKLAAYKTDIAISQIITSTLVGVY